MMNAYLTLEELQKLYPYAVFVATGADSFVPPIAGDEGEHVFTHRNFKWKRERYRTKHCCDWIWDDGIVLEKLEDDQIIEKPVDAIALSLGVRPNDQMVENLKLSFSNVKMIGDVNAPRKIAQAIKEGYIEASRLELKQAILV